MIRLENVLFCTADTMLDGILILLIHGNGMDKYGHSKPLQAPQLALTMEQSMIANVCGWFCSAANCQIPANNSSVTRGNGMVVLGLRDNRKKFISYVNEYPSEG